MTTDPMINPTECQPETCLRRKTKEMVISETSIILETVSHAMTGEEVDLEKENIEVDQGRGSIEVEVDRVNEDTAEVGAMIEVEETEDDHINKCT